MTANALTGIYDYRLVTLSVLIAILAAYAALDLAGRITLARGSARLVWMSGGALAMGMGIWSMHYIGMLAFQLPIPVKYDWPTVLISLLAAVLASGVALFCSQPPDDGFEFGDYRQRLHGSRHRRHALHRSKPAIHDFRRRPDSAALHRQPKAHRSRRV